MYRYNYNPTIDENKMNENGVNENGVNEDCSTECLICLEDDTIFDLHHYSHFNSDCSCNYYLHKQCLISWIKKKKNPCCLLCSTPIRNVSDITNISTRQTTEYHSRRARVIRLSLNQLLNHSGDNIIQVEPTIRDEQLQNALIVNNQEEVDIQDMNSEEAAITHVIVRSNTRIITCITFMILFAFILAGIIIIYIV